MIEIPVEWFTVACVVIVALLWAAAYLGFLVGRDVAERDRAQR